MSVSVKQSLNNLYHLMEITTILWFIETISLFTLITHLIVLNYLQLHLHANNCIYTWVNNCLHRTSLKKFNLHALSSLKRYIIL